MLKYFLSDEIARTIHGDPLGFFHSLFQLNGVPERTRSELLGQQMPTKTIFTERSEPDRSSARVHRLLEFLLVFRHQRVLLDVFFELHRLDVLLTVQEKAKMRDRSRCLHALYKRTQSPRKAYL